METVKIVRDVNCRDEPVSRDVGQIFLTKVADVLRAGVHVAQLHLRHLLGGQTVAGRARLLELVLLLSELLLVLLEVARWVRALCGEALAETHHGRMVGSRHVQRRLKEAFLRVTLARVQPQFGRTHKRLLAVVAPVRFLLAQSASLRPRFRLVVVLHVTGNGVFVERGHVLRHRLDRDELEADLALGLV